MNTCPLILTQGQLCTLRQTQDLTIRCHSGTLWITVYGDIRDHVLHPGDALQLQQAKNIVIEALASASLDITSTLSLAGMPHLTLTARASMGQSLSGICRTA